MSLGIMPSQDDKSYEPIAELVRINPVPSLIMDMETLTIVLVNEATAKLLGRLEKELLGKSVLDFVPAEDVPEVYRVAGEPPPDGENQWRFVVDGGKMPHVRLKYSD